jgi:hypothetical protein
MFQPGYNITNQSSGTHLNQICPFKKKNQLFYFFDVHLLQRSVALKLITLDRHHLSLPVSLNINRKIIKIPVLDVKLDYIVRFIQRNLGEF